MPTSGSGPDTGSPAADDPVGKDTLKRDARAVVGEAQSVVDEVKSEASAQIEQLAGQAKEQLSQASDKVRGIASDQKDLLADQVGGVAQALERVASDLQSSNDPSAQYARMIADNAEYQIQASPDMVAYVAKADGKTHWYFANFKGLKKGDATVPNAVKNILITAPATAGATLHFVPFLGAEESISGTQDHGHVKFVIPAIGRAAIAWTDH